MSYLLLAGALLLAGVSARAETPAEAIHRLTGKHTRLVWIRGVDGKGDKFAGNGPVYVIMALDTDDGGVPRVLVPEKGANTHPMITPSGERVIWTGDGGNVWIIDWDGKNRRKLLTAELAVGVAEDPPGVEWVYIAAGKGPTEGYLPIVRHQIDNMAVQEMVWNKTPSIEKWEFTRDGKYGASRFPATVASVSLPNGEFKAVANIGCTPGLSNDLSTVMHMMVVTHAGIVLYNRDGSNRREIYYTRGPKEKGLGPGEYWWSSFVRYDGRFVTFGGPYPRGNVGPGHIYFCALNEQRNGFSEWICVTEDVKETPTQPYGWIDAEGFGPKPTDKLTMKALSSTVSRLAAAKEFKPILDELAKQSTDAADAAKADEAKKILGHITGWGSYTLRKAQAEEATDLPQAVEKYKILAAKYAGLETGTTAQAKLNDKSLAKEVEAWKHVARILAAEKALTAPPSEKRSVAGRQEMTALKSALDALKKDFAGTKAESAGVEAAARVEAWPKKQLQAIHELETSKPSEAEAGYKDILSRFPETESAAEAKARLDDKAFRRNMTAWNSYLLPMFKAEESLRPVAKVKASVTEKLWAQRNDAVVTSLKSSALTIKKDYGDTAAWAEAQKILAKYDIALDQKN